MYKVSMSGVSLRRSWIFGAVFLTFLSDNTRQTEAEELAAPQFSVGTPVGTVLARTPKTVEVEADKEVRLQGWVVYNTLTCEVVTSGAWTVDVPPKHGTTATRITTGSLSNGACPGRIFPFMSIFYTWTDKTSTDTTDSFNATWTGSTFKETLEATLKLKGLSITAPTADATNPLEANSNVAKVSYAVTSPDTTTQVSWSNKIFYKTSGGKGASSVTDTFTAAPEATTERTHTAVGGQITMKATQGSQTAEGSSTISGISLDSALVVAELKSKYAGATKDLLAKISAWESRFTQFEQRKLFKVSALWPTEAFDGGSHIGLMMVRTKMNTAFDWKANVTRGALIYNDAERMARNTAKATVKAHPGLRALTGVELENMALVIYTQGNIGRSNPYYVFNGNDKSPDWQVTTTNAEGLKYVECVRKQSPPAYTGCSGGAAPAPIISALPRIRPQNRSADAILSALATMDDAYAKSEIGDTDHADLDGDGMEETIFTVNHGFASRFSEVIIFGERDNGQTGASIRMPGTDLMNVKEMLSVPGLGSRLVVPRALRLAGRVTPVPMLRHIFEYSVGRVRDVSTSFPMFYRQEIDRAYREIREIRSDSAAPLRDERVRSLLEGVAAASALARSH